MTIPHAIAEAAFTILGVRVRCYVLDDGSRILNAEDVGELFATMASDGRPSLDDDELQRFVAWQSGLDG